MNLRTRLVAAAALALVAQSAFAGKIVTTEIPALDDVGLAGLMVLIGIAGGIATRIRRRK